MLPSLILTILCLVALAAMVIQTIRLDDLKIELKRRGIMRHNPVTGKLEWCEKKGTNQ